MTRKNRWANQLHAEVASILLARSTEVNEIAPYLNRRVATAELVGGTGTDRLTRFHGKFAMASVVLIRGTAVALRNMHQAEQAQESTREL